MNNLIQCNDEQIRRLCVLHHVLQLDLFGSAARDDFSAGKSDVDLAVKFAPLSPAERTRHYFELQEELQKLLGQPVDLVEVEPIRNPYFLRSFEKSRVTLYDAA